MFLTYIMEKENISVNIHYIVLKYCCLYIQNVLNNSAVDHHKVLPTETSFLDVLEYLFTHVLDLIWIEML